jgi:hypothetical protein
MAEHGASGKQSVAVGLRMGGTRKSADGFLDCDACLGGLCGALLYAVAWLLSKGKSTSCSIIAAVLAPRPENDGP